VYTPRRTRRQALTHHKADQHCGVPTYLACPNDRKLTHSEGPADASTSPPHALQRDSVTSMRSGRSIQPHGIHDSLGHGHYAASTLPGFGSAVWFHAG